MELYSTERVLAKKGELTSPTSLGPTEETQMLKEYIERKNLFLLSDSSQSRRKTLQLKSFLKMKRNQQVEITLHDGQSEVTELGKVEAVGRDFVMLTNLNERFWIPYHSVVAASTPFGIPTYSNSHQHFLYDNDLQGKLVTQFGKTVSEREELLQLFCEDSLVTSLITWKGSWVEVRDTEGERQFGRMKESSHEVITLASPTGQVKIIPIHKLTYVASLRWLQIIHVLFNTVKQRRREQ